MIGTWGLKKVKNIAIEASGELGKELEIFLAFLVTWSNGNSVAINFSSNKNEVLKWFHKMT